MDQKNWDGGVAGISRFSYQVYQLQSSGALLIKREFPFGNGTSDNIDSALMRPFRKILFEGKSPGTITHTLHYDEHDYFILGSFVATTKYIIFFPGEMDRKVMTFAEQEYYNKGISLNVDHYTLDRTFETWHITLDEKRTKNTHFPTQLTKKIDSTNYLWFIYRIRHTKYLEKLPSVLEIIHPGQTNELKQIGSVMANAINKSIFNITTLHDEQNEEFFWQFEYFVNTSQNKDNYPQIPVTKIGGSGVTIRDPREQAPARTHHIILNGFKGSIFIRVSKILGTLENPIMFLSGHQMNYASIQEQV